MGGRGAESLSAGVNFIQSGPSGCTTYLSGFLSSQHGFETLPQNCDALNEISRHPCVSMLNPGFVQLLLCPVDSRLSFAA